MKSERPQDNPRDDRDSHRDPSTEDLLWEYIECLNRGEAIDDAKLRRDHPNLAEELLRQLEAFEEIGAVEGVEATLEPLGTLGDYTLRRQIGRGGMGVVYEAWENSMDRVVALKVLPSGIAADDKAFQRFCREAKLAGKLSHPNIVPVFGMGIKEDTPHYAMLTGQSPRRRRPS